MIIESWRKRKLGGRHSSRAEGSVQEKRKEDAGGGKSKRKEEKVQEGKKITRRSESRKK
jgi:hypothetical protein